MKREIICLKCKPRLERIFKNAEQEPGPAEFYSFVVGALRNDCLCDFCNEKLVAGERASALSTWTGDPANPLPHWPAEYLT